MSLSKQQMKADKNSSKENYKNIQDHDIETYQLSLQYIIPVCTQYIHLKDIQSEETGH